MILRLPTVALLLLAAASPASAATKGQRPWCLHNPDIGQIRCAYATKSACLRFVRSGGESCKLNKNLLRKRPRG